LEQTAPNLLQQSDPTSPTTLAQVTVTATSPLQPVTVTAQYEWPLSEAPLGDGLLDLVRQILASMLRPPHEILSPQDLKDAGINFQTGHYINRVGPENVGPVEDTGEGIVNDPNFVPGSSVCFTCNGVNYEMRTYVLPDGTINVGRIFPIE
jgi:hypothetical protein